jgi:hypothetical protein
MGRRSTAERPGIRAGPGMACRFAARVYTGLGANLCIVFASIDLALAGSRPGSNCASSRPK